MSKTVTKRSLLFGHRALAERLPKRPLHCASIHSQDAVLKQTRIDPPAENRMQHLILTPAHGQAFSGDRVAQTRWSSSQPVNKDVEGNILTLGGPSIRRVRLVCAGIRPSLLEQFSTDLPEVILLESAPAAKEFKIGLGLLASIKLNSRKLDAAYVIGGLRQQIVPWRCVFENSCFASDRALDGRVHCLSDDALTPVVINLGSVTTVS